MLPSQYPPTSVALHRWLGATTVSTVHASLSESAAAERTADRASAAAERTAERAAAAACARTQALTRCVRRAESLHTVGASSVLAHWRLFLRESVLDETRAQATRLRLTLSAEEVASAAAREEMQRTLAERAEALAARERELTELQRRKAPAHVRAELAELREARERAEIEGRAMAQQVRALQRQQASASARAEQAATAAKVARRRLQQQRAVALRRAYEAANHERAARSFGRWRQRAAGMTMPPPPPPATALAAVALARLLMRRLMPRTDSEQSAAAASRAAPLASREDALQRWVAFARAEALEEALRIAQAQVAGMVDFASESEAQASRQVSPTVTVSPTSFAHMPQTILSHMCDCFRKCATRHLTDSPHMSHSHSFPCATRRVLPIGRIKRCA